MTRSPVPLPRSARPRDTSRPRSAFRPLFGKATDDVFQLAGADILSGAQAFDPLPVVQEARRDGAFGDPGVARVPINKTKELFDGEHDDRDTGNFPGLSTGTFPSAIQPPFMSNKPMLQALDFTASCMADASRAAILRRLENLLADRAMSDQEASLAAGLGESFVRDFRRGKSKSPSMENFIALAAALETTPEWLAFGVGSAEAERWLVLEGEAASGVWTEIDGGSDAALPARVPITPDPRFPSDQQYALFVRGNSLDQIVRPPAILMCVKTSGGAIVPHDGDLVIVERRRADGTREITARKYEEKGGLIHLAPASNDPRWKAIALDPAQPNQDIQTVIVAVVVNINRPLRYSEWASQSQSRSSS